MKADETADRSSLSEQALARSERLLREMAQSMGEGLMVADREGRLLLMNPSAERLLGSPRALQSIEQWPAQFGIFRADRTTPMPPAELAMARALRGESHDRAECFVRNESVPEGRWVLASGRPLRDQAGEIAGAVVMLQDVTEQRLLEQRLLHAQKMEAIGTLAGGIAHDFNSVLYAVLGYAELALELSEGGSPARECIEQVLIGARRAQDLVKQLLIFGRKSQSERGPVRVQAVLAEALALMRGAIPSTIEIRSEIAPTCPSILADHTELHQVVMNLCTNAAHSMRERGGVLEISLQEARLSPDSAARTPGLEPGPYLRLMVRDTGCGMDAATRQRIFEPYFTTKRPGEGTGLGLAIVHGVVKGLGGVILVESEVGMGSCFEVYLPVDPRARASVEAIRRAAEDRAETGSQAGAPTP